MPPPLATPGTRHPPTQPPTHPPAQLGIASRLMAATPHAMESVFGAEYVSLHVRVSNRGAFHLYTQTLGYK